MIFCTAGKDRTGLLSALTLAAVGASDEEILNDYVDSSRWEEAFCSDMDYVGGLQKIGLDPKIFLGAHPETMLATLSFMRDHWGPISVYLNAIGFDASWQERLSQNIRGG